jgi:hypothetical protein
MAKLRIRLGAAALLVTLLAAPVHAQSLSVPMDASASAAPTMSEWDRDVFFFGGLFHDDYFTQSFTPWATTWEPNGFLGAGYQQFFWRWNQFSLGGEAGLGARFNFNGETTFSPDGGKTIDSFPPLSGEAWAGAVARYDGFDLGPVRVGASFTAGVSVVTGLIGAEAVRDSTHPFDRFGTGGKFLFYLGPELDFSMPEYNPNVELFVRAQHRSGGFSTLMDLDGSNADTIGLRYKF